MVRHAIAIGVGIVGLEVIGHTITVSIVSTRGRIAIAIGIGVFGCRWDAITIIVGIHVVRDTIAIGVGAGNPTGTLIDIGDTITIAVTTTCGNVSIEVIWDVVAICIGWV